MERSEIAERIGKLFIEFLAQADQDTDGSIRRLLLEAVVPSVPSTKRARKPSGERAKRSSSVAPPKKSSSGAPGGGAKKGAFDLDSMLQDAKSSEEGLMTLKNFFISAATAQKDPKKSGKYRNLVSNRDNNKKAPNASWKEMDLQLNLEGKSYKLAVTGPEAMFEKGASVDEFKRLLRAIESNKGGDAPSVAAPKKKRRERRAVDEGSSSEDDDDDDERQGQDSDDTDVDAYDAPTDHREDDDDDEDAPSDRSEAAAVADDDDDDN